MERVRHLTNRIYRETLCITTHERIAYITMGPAGHGHIQAGAFPWTPQCKILSWDLLASISLKGSKIPCSFTNFITIPELSGPLYISPDIFHAQITEYLLWALFSLHRTSSSLLFCQTHLLLPNPGLEPLGTSFPCSSN